MITAIAALQDWTGYFDASSPGTAVSTAAEAGGVAASTGAAAGACVTAAETSGSAATGSSLSALTAISHTTPTNAAHDPNVQFATLLIIFRSEEHTSELQSLIRISYAVFCLKNKIQHNDLNY